MAGMAGKRLELGSTGEAVAENVRRLLGVSDLNHTSLSAELAAIGRDIPPLAIGRIVKKERRVDVDDLVALAAALGVSPSTLLMPAASTPTEKVTAGGTGWAAGVLWEWLIAEWPYPGGDLAYLAEFFVRALPPWKQATIEARIAHRHGVASIVRPGAAAPEPTP